MFEVHRFIFSFPVPFLSTWSKQDVAERTIQELNEQLILRTKHLRRKLWFEFHLGRTHRSTRTYLQLDYWMYVYTSCMHTDLPFPTLRRYRSVVPKAFHRTDRSIAVWLTSSKRTECWSPGRRHRGCSETTLPRGSGTDLIHFPSTNKLSIGVTGGELLT
jgi:hypothetical protein